MNLPTDTKERVTFCFAFGDAFNGDNFDEALRYARFCVLYCKGMGIGLFGSEAVDAPTEVAHETARRCLPDAE